MSGLGLSIAARNLALAWAVLLGSGAALADDSPGTPMTAGVIVDQMPVRERTSYVMGAIDAIAFARFQKDTEAKGEKDYSGMDCVRDWLDKDLVLRMGQIDAAFRKYKDHPPAMVLAAMVKKACGE